MGPDNTTAPQPQVQTKSKRGEFLALRLVGAVGVTVLLTMTAAGAISTFIELLAKGQSTIFDTLFAGLMHETSVLSATMLLVLAVVPWLLFRSIKTSLASEPGFTKRTIYKVTMYAGLAVLAATTAIQLIAALSAVITSLLSIGVEGADIGGLYLHKFLPSLLGAVVTGFVAYCFWQTDRGRDKVNLMSLTVAIVSVVFAVALFIAAAVAIHSDKSSSISPEMPNSNSLDGNDGNSNKKDTPSVDLDSDTPSSDSDFEDFPY